MTSSNMVADIGTRRGAKVQDVCPGSKWIEGLDCLKLSISDFPVKEINQIKLNEENVIALKREYPEIPLNNFDFDWIYHTESGTNSKSKNRKSVPDVVRERYCYSD